MTEKQFYEFILIELNKNKAPAVLLEDFIYFLKKGKQQYINLKINLYDTSEQIDDDLKEVRILSYPINISKQGNNYVGTLPQNYLHVLNSGLLEFSVENQFLCYEIGDVISSPISRLPAKATYRVLDNYYFKPSYKNPYFVTSGNEIEIRSGNNSNLIPTTVYIDYIKKPNPVLLTQDQIDDVIDTSQELEFSEYVCFEIINIVVKLLMELSSDQRLQTNIPVNQTILPAGVSQQK